MNARLALLVAIFIGSVNTACPPDFVASNTISGKCYHISTRRTSRFFPAINYCRNNLTYGADILSIANGFENSEVASLLQSRGISDGAWIGAAFYDNKSHWIATAAGNSSYSNWWSGAYNGDVALIASNGGWSYADGYDVYLIICQIYPDDPITFPPPQTICPDGWRPSISAHGKCYKQIGDGDFFTATRNCLTTRIGDSHAELVTLTSQFEMIELLTIGFPSLWTSLTSWEADGYWRWVETLHPTDYFGPSGPPSTSEGTCAIVDSDDNLHGESCRSSEGMVGWGPFTVCQYFPDEPPAPTLPGLNCPQNGIVSITKPGTCYYVLDQRQTFQSAQSACQALDTGFNHNDLFVPRTTLEYEEFEAIVAHQVSYSIVWLGLTSSNDGNWGWISGRSSNITNMWCSGQPDTSQNPNDQCAFVNSQKWESSQMCWTAGDCTNSYPAICQSSNTFLST